ncbi:TetR/AcrR family transcriptional regulator [Herbiconiux sp. P17]|uniref:TetR/AcrR family transcriptional regulator n=1 Tax=Herbiconiux wuyangfengii TaxID=3342794 RepID=UPI0035B8EE63
MSMSVSAGATPVSFTKKGAATRARIIDAASELIFDRGVARTAVEEVQKKANVSPSQLYHYFGDKESLVRAVIARQTDYTINAQQPELGNLDSMAALRAWRDRVVQIQRDAHCEGGCALGSLASELSKNNESSRMDLVDGFERWEAELRRGLRSMKDSGQLRADAEPDQLAVALLSALEGGSLLTETRRSIEPVQIAVDAMLNYIETFVQSSPVVSAGA